MPALPPIYFERLLEDSPDIIVAVDRHGAIVFFNDGARTALGYLPEEVLGKHVRMFYPTEDDARAVMRAMRDSTETPGKVRNFQTTFVTRSGERLNVAISGALIHDEHGTQIGSIGFAKDLAEIQRQDQLTTLGEIAIGVAHEINNPLFAVLNNVSLIGADMRRMSDDPLYDVQAERLDSIESSVGKIQSAVNRLTEMADGGTYGTREYLPGAQMTDLRSPEAEADAVTPRVSAASRPTVDGLARSGPLSGLRVLVADDDLAVCHSVGEILRDAGSDVTTTASGREAEVELTRGHYDLVLSDVVMPDVDGYDLYMHVREHYPKVPVVLMTAFFYDRDHIIKRAKVAGLDGVLFKKPIDPERLVETVRERCGR